MPPPGRRTFVRSPEPRPPLWWTLTRPEFPVLATMALMRYAAQRFHASPACSGRPDDQQKEKPHA